MGFPQFLRLVLSSREVKVVSTFAAALFAAVYLLAVGIVFQLPYELPPSIPTPSADVVFDGPFGQVPWLTVYLSNRWVLSINPEALTSLAVLTALIWMNTAAAAYVSRYGACKPVKNIHVSWMAAVPALFSFFSCCGSGLVFSLLLASGASLSMLSFLQDYGRIFTALSALLLTLNLYMVSRRMSTGKQAAAVLRS
ncbi:MAG: hypothetical protein NZ570_05900 [Candidatus Caldarchaeum sp.]|nr:hypothetical protein [Candidatus Caldarchaeum sp.]MCS7137875.1 hypothetical protein [Candidatus Caldarchaeum sp.]MDW7977642.1 hypothetical protein [Candidatus Caldarchaeum sp.]MDW8359566.1 hypothetical protein [Candidatus Caldarchaeum sp.]